MHKLWSFSQSSETGARLDEFLRLDTQELLGVLNDQNLHVAQTEFVRAAGALALSRLKLPFDFPRPALSLPGDGFTPDYFDFGPYRFYSSRLRSELSVAADEVDYSDVTVLGGGPIAIAHDYKRIRVLAHQPGLDFERSDCESRDFEDRVSGVRFRKAKNLNLLALKPDFAARHELFMLDEYTTEFLVSDELATRVLRAGCVGPRFGDPFTNRIRSRRVFEKTLDEAREIDCGY